MSHRYKLFPLLAFCLSIGLSIGQTAEPSSENSVITIEKPKAIVMGDITPERVRLNIFAPPSSQLTYGVLQYKQAKKKTWASPVIFPLARSQYYTDVVDLKDLKPAQDYDYRIGIFHVPDQSALDNMVLNWDESNTPNYDQGTFHTYENFVQSKEIALLFGSCQYDGPLMDQLDRSPLSLMNRLMHSKITQKLSLFTRLSNLPGYRKTIGKTKLGTLIDVLALAEQEGTFIRTNDSSTFQTVIQYCADNQITLRGFLDMGDTYYRDWLNKYNGAKNTEEIYELIIDAMTTPGRHEIQKIAPTLVQIDDHAITDNYTLNDLSGSNYSLFNDACWRMTDLVQRQMAIYDATTKNIGYRWYETELWGLPVFVGDFRSEMNPGVSKISPAQLSSIQSFLLKWKKHPKIILSQVPIGPDDESADSADKWGDPGYQQTRDHILTYILRKGIKNTFWLGGDIHSGLFADIVHTKRSPDRDKIQGFPRTLDATETTINMDKIVLAQAVASPFNWPIQFETMVLTPYQPIGSSRTGKFCIVNQSPVIKRNHAGIFRLSDDGQTVDIVLLGNDPNNPAGTVCLKKTYNLVPY